MNPKVDWYFNKAGKWQEEVKQFRTIVLDCGLDEELKWGVPCYTFQKHNVVLIHTFKEYCAFLFHKGVLLQDPEGILVQQTENVQSARQIRFTGVREIAQMKPILQAYIYEALTPGRHRGYLLHFSAPKQSKTRESRIEKCMPQILSEKG